MQPIKRIFSPVLCSLAIFAGFSGTSQVFAQGAGNSITGLPVPRFVSLKSARVNMRVGPNTEYKIKWRYTKKGLPVEIIQEFDNWRKVRDPQGEEGWILHSLLAGKRTAIVIVNSNDNDASVVTLFKASGAGSTQLAKVEAGVVVEVQSCESEWCHVSAQNLSGYIRKRELWGVYPDELIE